MNNLYPVITRRIWLVAFGIGLIHGFGFAAVLQELGLPRGALALSLFGFNLGVEIGQVAIVSLFFPLVFRSRNNGFYKPAVLNLGSAFIASIALMWFTERALDLQPFLPAVPPIDLRAELAQTLPYLGNHQGSPLGFAGLALLGLIGLLWILKKFRVFAVSGSSSGDFQKKLIFRYSSYFAILLIMLGIGQTLSDAREEAVAIERAASVTASLTEPLRRQLAVSRTQRPRISRTN